MKVLSTVSQKGGTGKTTLATHLSVEAERNGHITTSIDLDPKPLLRRLFSSRLGLDSGPNFRGSTNLISNQKRSRTKPACSKW